MGPLPKWSYVLCNTNYDRQTPGSTPKALRQWLCGKARPALSGRSVFPQDRRERADGDRDGEAPEAGPIIERGSDAAAAGEPGNAADGSPKTRTRRRQLVVVAAD